MLNNPLKSDPVKQGKNLAKQIAKQMLNEPFEIGKSAVKQVSGLETPINFGQPDNLQNDSQNISQENDQLLEQKQRAQGQRHLQALENELKEITEMKKMEKQKEKAIQNQEDILKNEEKESSPFISPASKKSRNILGIGKKPKQNNTLQADRQKTRVEKIIPVTG